MKPPQSNRAKSVGRLGELLVIGGVAAEAIAAHLYSHVSAILPAAPDSSALAFCGAGALLAGLIVEWFAHRS